MSDPTSTEVLVKGGGFIAGVIATLWVIGNYILPLFPNLHRHRNEKFWLELKADPSFREYMTEIRDDDILKGLKALEIKIDNQNLKLDAQTRLLRNIRDIAADTARANHINVHYIQE